MKAVVVRQPWASLIAHGIKTIETRPFQPRTSLQPGDDLAIVAGKGIEPGFFPVANCRTLGEPITSRTWRLPNGHHIDQATTPGITFPRGVVVAVARYDEAAHVIEWGEGWLNPDDAPDAFIRPPWAKGSASLYRRTQLGKMDAFIETPLATQLPLGDFTPGRFGWLLSDVRRLDVPVPVTGRQGIFPLPDDVVAELAVAS